MKELWLSCPNCHLAFSSDKEYRHHYELDHPKRKFKEAGLIRSSPS